MRRDLVERREARPGWRLTVGYGPGGRPYRWLGCRRSRPLYSLPPHGLLHRPQDCGAGECCHSRHLRHSGSRPRPGGGRCCGAGRVLDDALVEIGHGFSQVQDPPARAVLNEPHPSWEMANLSTLRARSGRRPMQAWEGPSDIVGSSGARAGSTWRLARAGAAVTARNVQWGFGLVNWARLAVQPPVRREHEVAPRTFWWCAPSARRRGPGRAETGGPKPSESWLIVRCKPAWSRSRSRAGSRTQTCPTTSRRRGQTACVAVVCWCAAEAAVCGTWCRRTWRQWLGAHWSATCCWLGSNGLAPRGGRGLAWGVNAPVAPGDMRHGLVARWPWWATAAQTGPYGWDGACGLAGHRSKRVRKSSASAPQPSGGTPPSRLSATTSGSMSSSAHWSRA